MFKLLVIDTETGGLDPSEHSILSLGAVCWREGDLVDELEIFISEPQIVCTERALKEHRIDIEWLSEQGSEPREAVIEFNQFLERNFDRLKSGEKISLAGHNVGFDINYLKRLYKLAGSESEYERLFSHRTLDTASIIRFLYLAGRISLSSAALSDAIEYFDIELDPEERHTAIGDARATANLLTKLIETVP